MFIRSVLGENGDGAPRAAVLRIDFTVCITEPGTVVMHVDVC